MEIREEEFVAANLRGQLAQAGPKAVSARYDHAQGRIVIALSNGAEFAFPARLAQGLSDALPAELSMIEISPSGLGLHFPGLDADLYIPALLQGVFGSTHWMASQLGQAGGKAKSEAKAQAARENGKLGGRPRRGASR